MPQKRYERLVLTLIDFADYDVIMASGGNEVGLDWGNTGWQGSGGIGD